MSEEEVFIIMIMIPITIIIFVAATFPYWWDAVKKFVNFIKRTHLNPTAIKLEKDNRKKQIAENKVKEKEFLSLSPTARSFLHAEPYHHVCELPLN